MITEVIKNADREIALSRLVDAPRELVWDAWVKPEHVAKWWGPDGFTNTVHEMSVKPGGVWRVTMHGPDGTDYPNKIVFKEVKRPELLTYFHCDDGDDAGVAFDSNVTFEEKSGKTLVTLRVTLASSQERERLIEEVGALEGGKQTLGRLAAYAEKLAG
jgi:uncharacterized protein YndB with AHSA1/START domain